MLTFLNRNMTSVPKNYYSGERKAQILHTRLRLHCSSLNLDLYNNHISENDICSCGQTESAEHFLLNCTNYREVRENTLGRITVPYNIDILLKGCPLYSDDVNRGNSRQQRSILLLNVFVQTIECRLFDIDLNDKLYFYNNVPYTFKLSNYSEIHAPVHLELLWHLPRMNNICKYGSP